MGGTGKRAICRLCLAEKIKLLNPFESRLPDWSAADAIKELLQIPVSEGDMYPQYVCVRCMGKLLDFKLFKIECESNKTLLDTVCSRSHVVGASEYVADRVTRRNDNRSERRIKEEDVESPPKVDPLDFNEKEIELKMDIGDANGIVYAESIEAPNQELIAIKTEGFEDDVRRVETDQTDVTGNSYTSAMKSNEGSAEMNGLCENISEHSNTSVKEEIIEIPVESYSDESSREEDMPGISGSECTTSTNYFDIRETNKGCSYSGANAIGASSSGPHGYDKGPIGVPNSSSVGCIDVNEEKKGCESHFIPSNIGEMKTYSCGICGDRFAQMEDVQSHLSGHFSVKIFQGGELHAGHFRFPNDSLKQNQRDVKNKTRSNLAYILPKGGLVPPTDCSSNSSKDDLNADTATDSGKRYKCTKCRKAFCKLTHLNRHALSHTKRFSCSQCDKSFVSKPSLVRHITSIHKARDKYRCCMCNKSLSRKDQLRRHMAGCLLTRGIGGKPVNENHQE